VSENTVAEPTVKIDVSTERDKPQLVSFLFYDFHNRTAEDKLNLLGVFDQIFVDRNKKRTIPFGIFLRVAKVFEGKIRCDIYTPNGTLTGGFIIGADNLLTPEGKKPLQTQALLRLQFNAPTEGEYWFNISHNEQTLGGASLLVAYKDLEKEPEGEPTRGDA
jgi:hypothetical protein